MYDVQNVYSKEQLQEILKGVHGNGYHQNIDLVESLKENIAQSLKEKDVLSCRTLEDVESNQEKEDADLRKAEEERQKELEEARKAAELKEKEDTDL